MVGVFPAMHDLQHPRCSIGLVEASKAGSIRAEEVGGNIAWVGGETIRKGVEVVSHRQ